MPWLQNKKRDIVKKKISKEENHSEKACQANARRSVTKQAPTCEEECPMKFCVYLNGSNQWYLQSHGSCLDHKHHPKLDVKAVTLTEKDMSHDELKLTTLLYDLNVPLSTIAKVLTTMQDDDVGTFLPKTVFNINEKCQSLIDVANGILPTCSDAEKLSSYYKCKLVCFTCFCTTNSLFDLVVRISSCFVPQIHILNL
jgi:hypothetical protein